MAWCVWGARRVQRDGGRRFGTRSDRRSTSAGTRSRSRARRRSAIADDQGAALMDNVLGAQAGAVAMAPFMAESMKGGARGGPLPERPDYERGAEARAPVRAGREVLLPAHDARGGHAHGQGHRQLPDRRAAATSRRSASTRRPSTARSSRAASTARSRAGSSRPRAAGAAADQLSVRVRRRLGAARDSSRSGSRPSAPVFFSALFPGPR